MLERALDAGPPASWVTADEISGGDSALQRWLEDRRITHVLAVKGTEPLVPAAREWATPSPVARQRTGRAVGGL
jgi:hypothetical protein